MNAHEQDELARRGPPSNGRSRGRSGGPSVITGPVGENGRLMRRVIGLVMLLIVAAVIGGGMLYSRLNQPFRGYSGPEQFVDIPAGSSTRAIAQRLVAAGVVRDTVLFRISVWHRGAARRLRAGEYRFDRPMTPLEVAEKLQRGDIYVRSVAFPEGLTLEEMARIYEEGGFGAAGAFLEAAANPAPIAGLDPAARDLEGYLFPATYALPRRASARQLVNLMVARFTRAFTPELRRETTAAGRRVHDVVTLASLVERETARPDERPLVAAVYWNRLRIGMGLQSDPTVIYALQKAGRYDRNLTRGNLLFDSPYNTYRHAGLPPGPIAAPGLGSLEAAIRPAGVPYLYFVSRNDGSHVFAETLQEHNRNVRQFQVLYFRHKRQGAPH